MELIALAKPGFTSLSPDRETVASFDREGRLYAYYRRGLTYRRALDSTVEARWHARPEAGGARDAAAGQGAAEHGPAGHGPAKHGPAGDTIHAGGHDAATIRVDGHGAGGHLPPPARQRRRLTRQEAAQVFAEVYGLAAECVSYASGEVRERLETEILRWTPERLLAEEERFRRVYVPISILPPDQYLSIVLQATEGCTWNRC
ncbi:MAG TPA: hypothetical protein VIK98_07420, partial [Limnochordales bacterium]